MCLAPLQNISTPRPVYLVLNGFRIYTYAKFCAKKNALCRKMHSVHTCLMWTVWSEIKEEEKTPAKEINVRIESLLRSIRIGKKKAIDFRHQMNLEYAISWFLIRIVVLFQKKHFILVRNSRHAKK